MTDGIRGGTARWALAVLALWTMMFSLACRLPDAGAWAGARRDAAFLGLVVGGSRDAMSEEWVGQADRFLHEGVGPYRKRVFTDPFARLADVLSPRDHVHLHGQEAAEIMPWLWLAVRTDPHNADAYVTASFWMAGEVGRTDLALALLEEARQNNPRDYRVRLEQCRLFLRTGDTQQAWRALLAARRLWSLRATGDEDQARIDGAEILTYHGLLKEERGDVAGAVADYAQVVAWFPERTGLRTRLERLASGQTADRPASAVWAESLAARRHVCDVEKAERAAAAGHVHGPDCGHDLAPEHDNHPKHEHEPAPPRSQP